MGRPTKSQEAVIAKRRSEAVRLRGDGHPWQAIAYQLGYATPSAAANDVTRAREAALADLNESVKEIRDRELARLDMLYDAAVEVLLKRHVLVSGGKVVRDIEVRENELGELIITGDTEPLTDDGPTLAAIATLRQLSESRRKLLGLDAPTRVESSGTVRFEIAGVDHQDLT
ncbi:MAG: hypothetical protein ACRDJP_01705 [Actinomycetota bacterium]